MMQFMTVGSHTLEKVDVVTDPEKHVMHSPSFKCSKHVLDDKERFNWRFHLSRQSTTAAATTTTTMMKRRIRLYRRWKPWTFWNCFTRHMSSLSWPLLLWQSPRAQFWKLGLLKAWKFNELSSPQGSFFLELTLLIPGEFVFVAWFWGSPKANPGQNVTQGLQFFATISTSLSSFVFPTFKYTSCRLVSVLFL